MFESAIDKIAYFTRAIHSITRIFPSNDIQKGASTVFFINSEGFALTCRHVIELLINTDTINNKYNDYKNEISKHLKLGSKEKNVKRLLQNKYNYKEGSILQIKNQIVNCINGNLNCKYIIHPSIDLALIHFIDCELAITQFPIFPKDTSHLKPGKILCRYGFPFAEFTNYELDSTNDDIIWNQTGRQVTCPFPNEGMVTRLARNDNGLLCEFETSTPGFKGQSGGPVFDCDGKIWGVQFATQFHHLNFDKEMVLTISGKKKLIEDHPFLHVGKAIHIDRIKDFLRENNVNYHEE